MGGLLNGLSARSGEVGRAVAQDLQQRVREFLDVVGELGLVRRVLEAHHAERDPGPGAGESMTAA